MKLPLLALLAFPFSLAASNYQQFVDLASSSSNGIIVLDDASFDLLTSPKRNWSATVQFTAMDARRKCGACQ
jgi:oligosaccharyltransferase complex subunit gamma